MEGIPAGTHGAAAALHAAAVELRRSNTRFASPSEAHATVGELIEVHLHLMRALHELGQWHQQARPGADYGDDRQSREGVLESAFELRTAAEQCGELHQTLIRAHHAGFQVRWCEPGPGTDAGLDG